jgi:small GTP-binding protein
MEGEVEVGFLGDMAVGKTSIIRFYVYKEPANVVEPPTVGTAAFAVVSPCGASLTLRLIDTAGAEKYRALVPAALRRAKAIVVVFDLTRRDTFQSVPGWLSFISDHLNDSLPVYLVGNKTDLGSEIAVTSDEIEQFRGFHDGIPYFATSASTGEGISDLFNGVIDGVSEPQALAQIEENPEGARQCC